MTPRFNGLLGLAGAFALAFSLGRGAAPNLATAGTDSSQVVKSAFLNVANLEPSEPSAPDGVQNTSAFTYQGQLRRNGAPVTASCNASFKLFNAASGGAQIGGTVTSATLQVVSGLFTIALDFGWDFNGEARWLETAVGCGEAPVTLTPRTALRPAPYAFALPGMRTVPANTDFSGNPTMNVIGGVISGTISNTISSDSFNSVIAGGVSNRIDRGSDHSGVGSGAAHTIDNLSFYSSIAGGWQNRVDHGSYGSVIAGGALNRVDNNSGYSAVSGNQNRIDNNSDTGVIAGGEANVIDHSSDYGAIGGGQENRIDLGSRHGAIGGGYLNVITNAKFGAVPGGAGNRVEGDYGIAAGFSAQALHDGAFVWGDSTLATFASTGPNQFIVRASGGVGINTTAPTASLSVSGTTNIGSFGAPGTSFTGLQLGSFTAGTGPTQSVLFTVTFPSAYGAAPKVIVTPYLSATLFVEDAFAVTVRNVQPAYFVVRVRRLDAASGWGGSLILNWQAWR